MHLMPFETISDFLCLNQEKAPLLLKFGSQFVERSQANLLSALFSSNLYPILPESLTILFQGRRPVTFLATLDRRALHPLFSPAENIVVRKSKKIIPLRFVPIYHHVGKIIPIAPQCMSMSISLEPREGNLRLFFLQGAGPE